MERLAFKRMGSMLRNTYPGLESAIAQVKKAPAVDAAVLPCKVGDTVYRKLVFSCQKETVIVIGFDDEGIFIGTTCGTYRKQHFNKTVFFTREEAEASLERRGEHERD